MLLRFSVSNYKSFDEEVSLSMFAGASKAFPEHTLKLSLCSVDKHILKSSLLYGANASGKSNFIHAMAFAQELIVHSTRPKQPILVPVFKLDSRNKNKPSQFEFEFSVDGLCYAYGFAILGQEISEEWLYRLDFSGKYHETPLFERSLEKGISCNVAYLTEQGVDIAFYNFIALSTRPNELFLRKTIDNNASLFEHIYDWFENALIVIHPESNWMPLLHLISAEASIQQQLGSYLRSFDTGIQDIFLKKEPDAEAIKLPNEVMIDIREKMLEQTSVEHTDNKLASQNKFTLFAEAHDWRHSYLMKAEDKELAVYKLNTRRRNHQQEIVDFDLAEESDGTLRLLDFFPLLQEANSRVYIIDEIERSLHPLLVKDLLQRFLNRGLGLQQLIASTHLTELLDLDCLRRDSFWFVEKDAQHASKLYSLEEYKIRKDLDIHKGYLRGRFGAIPLLGQ